MGRGGAREGSGPKKKYEDYGQEKPGRTLRIPPEVPTEAVEQFIKEYLKQNKDTNQSK